MNRTLLKNFWIVSCLVLGLMNESLAQTPYRLKDITPGNKYASSSPGKLTDVNGTLFFEAFTNTNGGELWKSDGTENGTVMVKDIYPGTSNSDITYLANINGVLYFRANDGVNGNELWKSDGTSGGTQLVKDIRTGSASSYPAEFIYFKNTIFFVAADEVNGAALWTTDGTSAGTKMFKDLNPSGITGDGIFNLIIMNNTLYFWGNANGATTITELWKSDGTVNGTEMVKSFRGVIGPIIASGNHLFFPYGGGSTGLWGIWSSDGTSTGTILLKDMSINTTSNYLTDVNGTAMFVGQDASTGFELWKSDGTVAGTKLVKDINPGNVSSSITGLTNHKGILYFSANNGVQSEELWRSDGTEAGTKMVEVPYTGSTHPTNLYSYNGYLFFDGNDLWKSDGTAEGTVLVYDICTGVNGSSPKNFCGSNNKLFFSANDCVSGTEPWAFDVAPSGYTREVSKTPPFAVYPNPAETILTIRFLDNSFAESTVTLFDVLGNHLDSLTGDSLNKNNEIDISSYPKGICIVEVVSKTRTQVFKVVIK